MLYGGNLYRKIEITIMPQTLVTLEKRVVDFFKLCGQTQEVWVVLMLNATTMGYLWELKTRIKSFGFVDIHPLTIPHKNHTHPQLNRVKLHQNVQLGMLLIMVYVSSCRLLGQL